MLYRTICPIYETITITKPHISHLKIQTEAKIKVYRVETYDLYTIWQIFNLVSFPLRVKFLLV